MRRFVIAAVAVAGAVAASCASTGSSTASLADVRAAVDRNNATLVSALNAGRLSDASVVYAPDAMVLAANAPPIRGLPGIQQFWDHVGTMNMRNVSLTTEQLEVHGDVAIETGSYTMTLTPPGAPGPINDRGKYLVVWKRQNDGGWKIYRDMFSSNLPLQ